MLTLLTYKRLKELEIENRRLKQMYADSALDDRILKEIIEKSFNPGLQKGIGRLCEAGLCFKCKKSLPPDWIIP